MEKAMRAVWAAAAVGAAAWGGMYAVTGQLVKYAVERDAPPAFRRLEQAVTGSLLPPDLAQTLRQAETALARRPHQVVQIQSHDGIRLVGHWFAVPHARRAVLAMHGWRSSWCRDFGLAADFLRESGCSVLYVEQRGQNASGGACMGLGLTERYDCCRWAEWLAGQCGTLPLYLCGISMGASSVLMASGLPLPQTVRGIISDCGFTSPGEIGRYVTRHNLHLAYSIRAGLADRLTRRRLHRGLNACSTERVLRRCPVPVLFIHGGADRFVPVEMTKRNYAACRAEKRLLIVPGADHGASYYQDKAGYEAAVRAFWADFDSPGPCAGDGPGVH